jgi:ribosomal protein S18 acetylase RimI-like enzyme
MEHRSARPEDRPYLKALLEEDGLFLPVEIECALELIDQAVEVGQNSGYHALIAADGADHPMGYCCYGPTPMTKSTWDLYWVATHPRHRGQGVGRSLLNRMEMDVRRRGGNRIRLETSEKEGYDPARGLYDKAGYIVAGRIAEFYQPGDSLLTLVKQLS